MRDASHDAPSDPDPLGLIDAFLHRAASGDAEGTYLAWLVSLAPPLDPARAAGLLLVRPGVRDAAATSAGRHLLGLLEDTTGWPRPRFAALAKQRPGGKRA